MLVLMLIVIVLIGVAYADFCLVSNTAHFGICFEKVAEAEDRRAGEGLAAARNLEEVADVVPPAVFEAESAGEDSARPPRNPAPAWLLLDLEPVLELHEELAGAGG